MVTTLRMVSEVLPVTAVVSSQKDSQDTMTTTALGMYRCST